VRLHLVEGGQVEVDPIWILDWKYSDAYVTELARGGASLPPRCDPLVSSRIARWDELIAAEAAEHDLAPELVRAVIAVESCGDPLAISSAGAVGLMQLMPGTAADLGCADPRDPASNVDAGCRHLRRLLTLFDEDLELGLAAYHAGEGVVGRHRRVPPYPSTERYVRLVTTQLGRLARPPARSRD
jgi:soluble lytic murein transglycosylase-like protein